MDPSAHGLNRGPNPDKLNSKDLVPMSGCLAERDSPSGPESNIRGSMLSLIFGIEARNKDNGLKHPCRFEYLTPANE